MKTKQVLFECRSGKHDAIKVDPAMLPCPSNKLHPAIRKDIYTYSVLVIVQIEDHSLCRTTPSRKNRDWVHHLSVSFDKPTDKTDIAEWCRLRRLIWFVIRNPAIAQIDLESGRQVMVCKR